MGLPTNMNMVTSYCKQSAFYVKKKLLKLGFSISIFHNICIIINYHIILLLGICEILLVDTTMVLSKI